MLNPSYLIKSRHDIYYFRYPLPASADQRVSISLRTRCPREALQLSKMLEYHGSLLLSAVDWMRMEAPEISSLFKQHFIKLLEKGKARIDRDGCLTNRKVEIMQSMIDNYDLMIEDEANDMEQYYSGEESPDGLMHDDIKRFMSEHDLEYAPDSSEYALMKKLHKFARRSYYLEVLDYNRKAKEFSLRSHSHSAPKPSRVNKQNTTLGHVLDKYLDEIKASVREKGFNEQRDCMNYLIDWLGTDFPIENVDDGMAREAKELLRYTPRGRNKSVQTRGLALREQVAIAKENNLPMLSSTSVNKYLGYFGALFKWAESNRYREGNPFAGIKAKNNKKANRREHFNKAEVKQIMDGLGDGTPNKLLKNSSQYWGTLIAVYTGARLNEIASLLPDDVKQDETSGIWYFDVTDEKEEGKDVKTDAAVRVIPIHSRLLELGFLEFVEHSKTKKGRKDKYGHEPRLLYDMTYTPNDKWGRNLGRWVNDKYLVELGLKVKNKKTLHSLRHSMITFLSVTGTDNAIIKSIVGHEADTVTSGVYTHYGLEHLPIFKEAIEKLPY